MGHRLSLNDKKSVSLLLSRWFGANSLEMIQLEKIIRRQARESLQSSSFSFDKLFFFAYQLSKLEALSKPGQEFVNFFFKRRG